MVNAKLLTIIIPSYNIEKYILRAIQSLVIKEIDLLDILVINDGSTDGTLNYAKCMESKYPHSIRVIDKKNGNYGSCVNIGIHYAQGKYIKILDGDDYLDNKAFSEFVNFLQKLDKKDNVDAIFSNYQEVDENGKVIAVRRLDIYSNKVLPLEDSDVVKYMQHHFVTYRTENIKNMKYIQTEGIPYTDQEWISIPLFTVNNIYYYDASPLYCYFIGREGQSMEMKGMIKNSWCLIEVLKNMIIKSEKYNRIYKENYPYVMERIKLFGILVYKFFIVEHYQEVDFKCLKNFDKWLCQNNPEIYEMFDAEKFGKKLRIKFIKMWRKNLNSIWLKILRGIV